MADSYEVRKRLLELDADDIGLIAVHPIIGPMWAKRANVKSADLARRQQRAVMALKTAMMKDASSFAADLAKLWHISITLGLENEANQRDPMLHGIRIAATLIGSAGARALVSCLAAADYDVSAEVVERFDELTAAARRPLSENEVANVNKRLEEHLPGEVLARLRDDSEPKTSNAETAEPTSSAGIEEISPADDLDSAGAHELIAQLRTQAQQLASKLSTAAEGALQGGTVSDLREDVDSWNSALLSAWAALGGPSEWSISFDNFTHLAQRIAELEAAAAEARIDRDEKVAQLEQLRLSLAGLEPLMHTNETFLSAYELALAQVRTLEQELSLATEDAPSLVDAELNHGGTKPIASEEEATKSSKFENGREDEISSIPEAAEWLSAQSDENTIEAAAERQLRVDTGATPEVEQAGELSAEQAGAPERLGSGSTPTNVPSTDSPTTGFTKHDPHPPWSCDTGKELTAQVTAGRFGAAWLVASAAGLPEHEVKIYRVAAAAFHSIPNGGIEPSEVLISLASNSTNAEISTQSARVALAATLRAALAAGWSPRSELEALAALANLDSGERDLVMAVVAASDRNYQHFHNLGRDAGLPPESVQDKARELRAELDGLRIKFARADKVLKYLLRANQPIGHALDAILADTNGEHRQITLTEALAALDSSDEVIEAADAAVSTHQQRRNPIESHALRRLRRAIESVTECVTDALNSAVNSTDDSQIIVAQEVQHTLVSAARAVQISASAGPGDAAIARLLEWIVKPAAPFRWPNELQLLLDETLPAVSAPRDADGLPVVDPHCAAATIEELRSPVDFHALFEAYVSRGDLQEAAIVARQVPDLMDRLAIARSDWKRRLEREVSAVRADLARTYADEAMRGPQASIHQVEAEARLVEPDEYAGDRYDLQIAELQSLRSALASHRAASADDLRQRVQAEINDQSDRERIFALIDAEDFVGANELIALARRGPLPDFANDRAITGSELFDSFVEALTDINLSPGISVGDLIDRFADSRHGGISDSDRARLSSWGDLASRGRHRSHDRGGKLFSALRGLGLDTRGEPSRQTLPGVRHFDLFRVNATPVDGSLVPGLGSQATHYMVAVTADHKLLRETLSSGFPAKSGPNIVLFDGVLTMDQRRQCLSVCREKKISAIVVDHAVAAFIAARHPRSFRAVQQLTLPFTCFTHYTVVAGNVPDEVFVGRNEELAQLADRTGSLFVYGGRQLGKSALLRKIQRDFSAVPDQHAIFIDLNSHGMGTWADPQQIWPVLHNELAKIGSMGIKASSAVRNHDVVTKAIRNWLDAKDSRRLLLLLDEADAFLEKESRDGPNGFRNIGPLKGLFDHSEGRFKPVFAGLHKVQRLQNVANTPLAHGGRDVLIGPLAAGPARNLVVKPLEALGYRFDNPETVWRLLAFTNLQPGLIQVVCNDLVAHLQARPLRKGEPLIAISEADVDFVTGAEITRSKIAEKLRLTIALEDRYRVIALAVAIISMEDNFREKYTAVDIRQNCQDYWQQGFQDLNSAEFEVYLEELVGLGVLTKDKENLFAVRSPNIVTMLGTKEQLITELIENIEQFELPHEYNPRSTRRQLTTDTAVFRSPLSEHDLSQLIPVTKKYDARTFVVVGGEALGIKDVEVVVSSVGTERGVQVTVIDAERDDVLARLREFRWTGGGTSAPRILVVNAARASETHAESAAAALASVRSRNHGHLIFVVGPGGVDTLAQFNRSPSGDEPRLIILEKWSGDGIRSRHDNPFNTPADRVDLLRYSGGWPELVEQAIVDAATRNVSYAEQWNRLSEFPEDRATAQSFLRRVGVTQEQVPLLAAWAELGSETYESIEDVAAVLDRDAIEVRRLATNLALIGAVNESQGAYAIDAVVARSLSKLV
ncbi:MAG: hypothetical protein AB1925_22310 [Actinomycetota bacterium]